MSQTKSSARTIIASTIVGEWRGYLLWCASSAAAGLILAVALQVFVIATSRFHISLPQLYKSTAIPAIAISAIGLVFATLSMRFLDRRYAYSIGAVVVVALLIFLLPELTIDPSRCCARNINKNISTQIVASGQENVRAGQFYYPPNQDDLIAAQIVQTIAAATLVDVFGSRSQFEIPPVNSTSPEDENSAPVVFYASYRIADLPALYSDIGRNWFDTMANGGAPYASSQETSLRGQPADIHIGNAEAFRDIRLVNHTIPVELNLECTQRAGHRHSETRCPPLNLTPSPRNEKGSGARTEFAVGADGFTTDIKGDTTITVTQSSQVEAVIGSDNIATQSAGTIYEGTEITGNTDIIVKQGNRDVAAEIARLRALGNAFPETWRPMIGLDCSSVDIGTHASPSANGSPPSATAGTRSEANTFPLVIVTGKITNICLSHGP